MQNTFLRLIMLAFLVGLGILVLQASVQRPHILVVHSYNTDYIWTQQINTGLDRVFKGQNLMDIQYHYMNTKNFKEKSNLRRSGIAARHAVDAIRPDVLIAIDDDAQELVAKHYVQDSHIQIVHAGINGNLEQYGYNGANNVTGILERKPLQAIKEMVFFIGNLAQAAGGGSDGNSATKGKWEQGQDSIPTLLSLPSLSSVQPLSGISPPDKGKAHDTRIRALFLSDNSKSVRMDAKFLKNFPWAPVDYRGNLAVQSYQEWQDAILGMDEMADIVLVGGYRELTRANGKEFVPPEEVMRWTDNNSKKPVIGMNVFNAADGAMISLGVSPFEQGEVAARMTLDILKNKVKASAIPTRSSEQYVLSMRKSAIQRRGIDLPSMFEAFSRTTNNFFE
ncbi:MAG: hypothetical protein G8345_11025 [Magnetococcales bacterium]|nr:hypothetical protein [Magnetococcales bacterium]NGZ27405.1 hypothetical protein [Magnetococcales bacterium]